MPPNLPYSPRLGFVESLAMVQLRFQFDEAAGDDEEKFGDFQILIIRSDPCFSHSRPGIPSTTLTTCSSSQVGQA